MEKSAKDRWTALVKYINIRNIGDIIDRKDIIKLNDEGKYGNTTTDNYRLWLQNCKYLESVGTGKYKILKHIDTKLSSSEIKKRSYNKEYRINIDRFEKLNIILNEKTIKI